MSDAPDKSDRVADSVDLVHWVIRRYLPQKRSNVSYDYDDLVQAGLLGLLHRQHLWEPAKGSWSVFAIFIVRNAASDYIRKATEAHYAGGTRRIGTFQDVEASREVSIGPELYGRVHEDVHSGEWREAWSWCLEGFDTVTQEILESYYVEGVSIGSIAAARGKPRAYVRKILGHAKSRFVRRILRAGIHP